MVFDPSANGIFSLTIGAARYREEQTSLEQKNKQVQFSLYTSCMKDTKKHATESL